MNFKYLPIKNGKQIGKKRLLSQIKFIVIHYTGNYNKGADAMAHFRYLQTAERYGSAHYFVDDKNIIQTIGDSFVAWGVGDNQGYGRFLNGCNNSNSISIEMCVNIDSNQALMYKNTLELTKNLMKKFNIDADHVCRHYDVSKKDCPHNFKNNNWAKWWQFKEDIKQPIEWNIDLSKDSTFGEVKKEPTGGFFSEISKNLQGQELNILPSVTIAQAILESNWGKSTLAVKANNLFGIKASKDWSGQVFNIETKEQKADGTVYTIKADFRKYNSWIDSVKDHDKFFISTEWRKQNYKRVLEAKDYKEQAKALQDCGYATDKKYADKLISLIEKHNLNKFDKGAKMVKDNKPSEWAKEAIEWAKEYNISDGTRPKDNCTREEVVVMIKRLYELLKLLS